VVSKNSLDRRMVAATVLSRGPARRVDLAYLARFKHDVANSKNVYSTYKHLVNSYSVSHV